MTLCGIVTSFLVTGKSFDEIGLRYVSIWMRSKGEDYSVVIKVLATQTPKPGDEIAVERSCHPRGDNRGNGMA